MSDSPSIKAQVRLRFKNVNNQTMSIVRSLSVTVKKSTYTQKTLENVLAAVDPQTGELATISAKCAEIDTDVPNHLGVSQAILDNVIFCHQEDSNWPLSEPAILKKRFDEIFASTKYTNVLDSIKAIRKEKAQDLKIMHTSLEFIRLNKEKAEKAESLSRNMEDTESSQRTIEKLELDIEICADEVTRLIEKTKELQEIETTLNTLSHEHKSILVNIQELEGMFTLYSQSDFELQEMLFKHELSLKTADMEKAKHEGLKRKASSAVANLQTSVNTNQQSIGQLKALLDSNKKKQTDRDNLISELATLYSFDGFNSLPLVNSDVPKFFSKMEVQLQQKSSVVERIKRENLVREQEVRSRLADRKAKIELSSSVQAKNEAAISSAKAKLWQQTSDLSKYQSTETDIQSTENLLAEHEKSLASLKPSDLGLESMESKKRAKMADVEAFENELSMIADQNAAQAKNAGLQAKLTLLKKTYNDRSNQIESVMRENKETLSSILGENPLPERVEAHIAPVLKERETAADNSKETLEKCKREQSSYDIRIDDIKLQIQKFEATLGDCEKQIAVECGTKSLPDLLATKEEGVTELREQVQDIKTMSTMYGRFVTMAEKKHACPLCSRGFDPTLEAQFTAKLRRLMEKAENDDERELTAMEASLAALRSLKYVWDTAERLRSTEIPALKAQLAELEERKIAVMSELEAANMETTTVVEELENLRKLVAVAKNISELCKEKSKESKAIEELKTELLCAGSTHSTEQLQAEYSKVKQKVQSARQDLMLLNEKIAQSTADIQREEEIIRSLREKHSQLLNQRQLQAQVSEQVRETEAMIQSLAVEVDQHRAESYNVMPELNRLNEELQKAMAEGQAKEASAQQDASELKNNLGKVQMYTKDLERVDTQITMTDLSKLEAATDRFIEEIREHYKEVKAAEKQMQSLQEQLTEFKDLQRNINDNLRYRRYVAKAKELEDKIAESRSKKNGEAKEVYSRQLKRLSQRQSDLTTEKAGLKGELRQLQDQRRQYEDELSGEYKDVVQKYHDCLIGYKTTELASQDLEKYMKALQSAIVEYHSMKMEEINKSIKELWTNTYRGTDIDTIEIRSDQEGLRANQTYNYRVVMIQRGRALDMRGRCSAGQKVLASIIIRLALAESFSLNCGILALDEPTTNLDEANVAQLAYSLRTIIDKHRQQSNFQLIVITHDEDFLKMLNLTEYVDWYYRVRKNAE
ncbi:DNA repair protein rad50 [Dissophora ornata]|nr:DNA repair protein rad50 [Dissophora ornata]